MKLACFADSHLRDSRPINRKDPNYWDTVSNKFDWMLNYCEQRDINFMLCAGDLLDKPTVSDHIKTWLLENICQTLLVCYGQHELAHRNLTDNCSLRVLEAADLLTIMDDTPHTLPGGIAIYGSSFGQDIPDAHPNPDGVNVLLVHRLLSNRDYWHGHVQYSDASDFLKKHNGYDLIVSGDNHKTFVVEHQGRVLINPGSLMRQKIDQIDHSPCFFIYDTKSREYKQVFIPIQLAEDVFDLEPVEEQKQENQMLNDYMADLQEASTNYYDFKRNVLDYMSKNQIGRGVKAILEECIE